MRRASADMVRLLGYTDRLSVAPGQTIDFMVSCDRPDYDAHLVRLIHGDENPDGPGFKQVLVPSEVDGRYAGHRQEIRSGSYVEIPLPPGATGSSLAFSVYLLPTNPGFGVQAIASIGDPYSASGWGLVLTKEGAVELVVGPTRISTGAAVHRWTWYRIECTVERGHGVVRQTPVRALPNDGSAGEGAGEVALPPLAGSLILGAMRTADGMAACLDGKLDDPVLAGVGAWDFATDMSSDRVTDRLPGGHHGWTVNTPTRAVTGHAFDGSVADFHLAPEQWSAIHLHRDDLDDAGWDVAFSLTIPDDLPSGIYAAWLRSGDDEDHLPFTVRRPRGTARSRIAILMSTLTYTVYANFTDLGPGAWKEGATNTWASGAPHGDPSLFRDVYRYIDENALYGTYDLHVDGSGVVYGSYLRPILNMRPKFRYRIWAAPPRFPADLYLVDWLDHEGIEADFITDHDLQVEGAALLDPYAVVVSSSHHEYWSSQMLDALECYLSTGGRFMLLGGNSLFGVASFDPDPAKPHRVEVRRWGAPWPFEVAPAERVHSTTGEPGGTWRNRGRPPNRIVGVGTSAAGFDRAVPYKRMPDSLDPRVRFIFEGIGDDQLIGDQPNLQTQWGAAGYEIDRFDHELGTPASALLLASSIGFSDRYRPMLDEVLWYMPGRDGKRPDDPQVDGEPHRFVRSDMAYLEYPNGGAVFSVGSIAWRGGIAHNGYANSVSLVTGNVLRRFAERPRGMSPSDPA